MTGLRAKRRGPKRTVRPSRILLLVFTMTVMLLGPIGEQLVLAQADDQVPTEEPQPEVQPTEEPLATEPAVATEVPEEIVATETVVAENPHLTISVYRCDHPQFDPYFSSNAQMVIEQCTGTGFGNFAVTTAIPVSPQSGSTLDFEIQGFLEIAETLQPGYDNALANCFIYDAGGNLVDQIGPGEANGGYWKVGGIADGDVHCDWYQVDRGIGNVYVVNMACPSTAGLFPKPSMDDLVSLCTEPAGARQFFVVHTGNLERMGVSGGEFNDVLFEAIPAGPIAIRMDDPGNFESARVFCQVNTLEGVEISPFAEVSVASFRTTGLTLGHGQRLHCSWFNILQGPGLDPGENQTPVATTPPVGNLSTLTIQKHTCPAGYDPTADGIDPMADCPSGPNGVNFTLADTDPNTVDLQTMTGDSINNAVTFGGLRSG